MSLHRRSVAALLLAASLPVTAALAQEAPSAGDCLEAAFEANDPDAVAACYTEDGIIWFPGGSMAQGRAAIREGFAHYLGEFRIKDVQMTRIGGSSSVETRAAWGTYVITSVNKATGQESVDHGRFVDVQKQVDGKWLYVVDHPSSDPVAPAK